MIVEIIGVPGSGKTTLASRLMKEHGEVFYCIRGKSTIESRRKKGDLLGYIQWFIFKLLVFLSFFLTPFTVIIFFKYLIHFLSIGLKEKLSKTSNPIFFIYVISLLNYQLIRYLLAVFIFAISSKNVIIDEGFFYNAIRLRQFVKPELSAQLYDKYIQSLSLFRVNIIELKIDSDIALQRYIMRERDSSSSLYKRWYVDQSDMNWMHLAWEDIGSWVDELMSCVDCDALRINESDSTLENLKIIMDYVNEYS